MNKKGEGYYFVRLNGRTMMNLGAAEQGWGQHPNQSSDGYLTVISTAHYCYWIGRHSEERMEWPIFWLKLEQVNPMLSSKHEKGH
jgi:hypothetical protein